MLCSCMNCIKLFPLDSFSPPSVFSDPPSLPAMAIRRIHYIHLFHKSFIPLPKFCTNRRKYTLLHNAVCKCKGADPLSPMQAGCSFETRCTAFAGEPAAAAAQFCKIETRLCACGPHCDGIALCQTFSVKQVCSLALPMEEVQTIPGGKKEETLDERQTREVPTSKIATAVD